jgi:hypothetical protein
MNISLPKDLIEIIEQLIIYEDSLKEEEIDDFEYEYAYIEDRFEDIAKKEDSPTVIKISL